MADSVQLASRGIQGKTIGLVLLLVVLAFIVRAMTMVNGWTLDGDECQMVNLVITNNWDTLWTAVNNDGNPPLMYVVLKLWSSLFGTGDVAFKAAVMIVSCAIPPAVFLGMRGQLGQTRALIIGLLCCLCPALVDDTTRVRSYGLMVLIGFWSILLFSKLMENPKSRVNQVLWAVCNSALVYSHLSAAMVPLAEGMYVCLDFLILRRDWHRIKGFFWAGIVAIILILPLIFSVVYGAHGEPVPWRIVAPLSATQFLPNIALSLWEPYMHMDPIPLLLFVQAVFWSVIILAPILSRKLAAIYPAFPARLWAFTTFAMLLVQLVVTLAIIRPAYSIHFTVPILIMLVAITTALLPMDAVPKLKKYLPAAVLPLLLGLWLWELSIMHDQQLPTMKNLIDVVNSDVPDGKPALLVVSTEWYGPVVYRYLRPDLDFLSFPEVDKVPVINWHKLTDRLADQKRMPPLLEKIQARLDAGQPVYHLYVVLGKRRLKKLFELTRANTLAIDSYLQAHGRRVQFWQGQCFQSPGYADWLEIDKFVPLTNSVR